jgi:hypothetical protein
LFRSLKFFADLRGLQLVRLAEFPRKYKFLVCLGQFRHALAVSPRRSFAEKFLMLASQSSSLYRNRSSMREIPAASCPPKSVAGKASLLRLRRKDAGKKTPLLSPYASVKIYPVLKRY